MRSFESPYPALGEDNFQFQHHIFSSNQNLEYSIECLCFNSSGAVPFAQMTISLVSGKSLIINDVVQLVQ